MAKLAQIIKPEPMTRRYEAGPESETAGIPSFTLLGVTVNVVQIPRIVEQIERWIETRTAGRFVSAANTHVVMEAQHDASFKQIINSANLCAPDGMPLIWYGRYRGHSLPRRAYGPELMITFCRETAAKGYRHFLFGGDPDASNQLVKFLRQACPGIQIAGAYSPPFRPLTQKEDDEIVERINRAEPDILWVGLGCPKQERWIHDHRQRLVVPVMVAIGQAFDILSGRKKPAPAWMQEKGLEWCFRLLQEPRRLWRRYLFYNTKFIYLLLLEILGVKQFD